MICEIRMGIKGILLILFITIGIANSSDITSAVFGNFVDGMPAAFGDFNSDELTDVFVLTKNSKTLEILFASEKEPLLRPTNLTCPFKNTITSVVPGDFDGDVFMDALVTTEGPSGITNVYILWGGVGTMTCVNDTDVPIIKMHGQPLTVDYNQDMIIDLFGSDVDDRRTFWIFGHNRTSEPTIIHMQHENMSDALDPIRSPHSNAFLDLNHDYMPDLMVTTKKHFEIWHGVPEGFVYHEKISWPYEIGEHSGHVGQSLYLDVEFQGEFDLVVPICFDTACKNSTIAIYKNGWHNLQVKFTDPDNNLWGFIPPAKNNPQYTDTITFRGGDFNMDGYPDLLATLRLTTASTTTSKIRSFLLLNVACSNCQGFSRTFEVHWQALYPFQNETVMAVFYDFYQDGILDVILVEHDKTTNHYHTDAFKNSLDYDANFVKVMVLTGLANSQYPISAGSLGKKKHTYGTNLPGPSITYKTTTQEGNPQSALAAQLPLSAHFSLNLPYTIFGLDRTPNFIETLTVGVSGHQREWTQIIPNSQIVVIPNPVTEPSGWKVRLFVTPSKLIILSAAALTATCVLISAIIVGLYWKERREDKIERLQEAHRFHFDAM